MRLGEFDIDVVQELLLSLRSDLLPDLRESSLREHLDWLAPRFYSIEQARLLVSIHTWLVRARTRTVLIDTCAGNCKRRPSFKLLDDLRTPFLERLEEAGVAPSAVDLVVCTHLHVDHVGWNTRLENGRWIPAFPNARYVFPRLERERRDPAFGVAQEGSADAEIFRDSVLPVLEAGQAWLVEGDEELLPGMKLVRTPGHAPGQVAVRLLSGAAEALFVGDVLHHPLQVCHPHWNSSQCEDAEGARRTRVGILEYCARTGALMLPAHFAAPHCGRVRATASGYAFTPGEAVRP